MGENQKRLSKKPGRGGFWFSHDACVLGVSGKGREQGKDGDNAMSVPYSYFILFTVQHMESP